MVLLCETWFEIWAGAELFVKPRGSRFLRSNAQYKNLVSALHFDCSPIRLQATIFGWPNCVTWPVGLILFVKNLPAEGPASALRVSSTCRPGLKSCISILGFPRVLWAGPSCYC